MNVIQGNFRDDRKTARTLRKMKAQMEDIAERMRKIRDSKPVADLELKADAYDQDTLNINERYDIEKGDNTLT